MTPQGTARTAGPTATGPSAGVTRRQDRTATSERRRVVPGNRAARVVVAARPLGRLLRGAFAVFQGRPFGCTRRDRHATATRRVGDLVGGRRPRRRRGHAGPVSYDPTIYQGAAAHYRPGRPPYSPELEGVLTLELRLGHGRR